MAILRTVGRPSEFLPSEGVAPISLVACDVRQGDALVLAAGPGIGVVIYASPDPALLDRGARWIAARSALPVC